MADYFFSNLEKNLSSPNTPEADTEKKKSMMAIEDNQETKELGDDMAIELPDEGQQNLTQESTVKKMCEPSTLKPGEKKIISQAQGNDVLTLEIPDSKFKSKSIFFNPFWNCFILLDSEEQLWMLEFFPPVYFQNYWTNFEYLEQNQLYIEKEDEFDRIAVNRLTTPDNLERFRTKFSLQCKLRSNPQTVSIGKIQDEDDLLLAVINNEICEA